MSISEIESILLSLRARHPDLDAKMLETLLLSGGWESSIIKDTLLLFKAGDKNAVSSNNSLVSTELDTIASSSLLPEIKKIESLEEIKTKEIPVAESSVFSEVVQVPVEEKKDESYVPVVELSSVPNAESVSPLNDLVYITNDGKEEGVLVKQEHVDVPDSLKEEPLQIAVLKQGVIEPEVKPIEVIEPIKVSGGVPSAVLEKESLIVPIVTSNPRVFDTELPGNLPLRPFESGPSVWSFSKYKDVFYGEVMPPVSREEKHLKEKKVTEHFNVEKTPLDKEDESLVFLAGTMLLVIILILGYMYSNGRL